FDLQLHRRAGAQLLHPVSVPSASRHRHGRRMASRCALSMETWPARSRGFMGAVMQGSWGIGFLLSSALYGLFYNYIGWRGLLMAGILPAFLIIWIRIYVKEPAIWLENQRQQKAQGRE